MDELNRIQELVKQLVANKDLEFLGPKIQTNIEWLKNAKTPEERAQAELSIKILTEEIPKTIQAKVAKSKAKIIANGLILGLEIAKLVLKLPI